MEIRVLVILDFKDDKCNFPDFNSRNQISWVGRISQKQFYFGLHVIFIFINSKLS